jgi:hypothetical protein
MKLDQDIFILIQVLLYMDSIEKAILLYNIQYMFSYSLSLLLYNLQLQ